MKLPLMLGFVLASMAFGQGAVEKCVSGVLPRGVAERLTSDYSEWRIKSSGDLHPSDRGLWMAQNGGACPGIASGHFMRARASEFAVLMVPKMPDQRGFVVLVFSISERKRWNAPIVLRRETNQGSAGVVVYRLPPGEYYSAYEERKVKIKLDGIQVETIEATATLYFWSINHFEELLTSN
jgi:hypothetical protein